MRLMASKDRDAVAREVMSGLDAQVAAHNGDFGAVAAGLDDPRWVGRQMVRVYGVALPWKLLVVALAAALAWASAPGALGIAATDPSAVSLSLVAFGALIALLFALLAGGLPGIAVAAAAAAAAVRAGALAAPQEGVALFDQLSVGELALYLLTTLLLLVVAGVPAWASRRRQDSE
jgi:hypothetical protein